MRLLLTIIWALFSLKAALGQSLISNGNFEDRNTCVEHRAVCAPEAWFRIPLDAVSPAKGTAGYLAGNHNENIVMENVKRPGINRSYLYTRLLCPLEKGKEYIFTASFRVPNDNNFYRMDLLWLTFEPFHFQDKIAGEKTRFTIRPENKIADEPYGWKKYLLHFIATGNEKYLLLGNLQREVFPGKPTALPRTLIIYEIDNVSLMPADQSVAPCTDYSANKIKLYNHNYRHTPGQFIDDEDEPVAAAPSAEPIKTDTPLSPPVLVTPPVPAPPVNDTLVIPDVLFKFDKSDLKPVFAYRLDSLTDRIKNKTFKRIEILGHTDSLGNNQYNQTLSKARAETVKRYLMGRLRYPEDNIVTKAFAATLPVSPNSTAAGRQKNRRVEIVLIR